MQDTVSRSRGLHGNSEMTVIGYVMAAILLVVVLPLLPIFLMLYLVDRLVRVSTGGDERGYSSFE